MEPYNPLVTGDVEEYAKTKDGKALWRIRSSNNAEVERCYLLPNGYYYAMYECDDGCVRSGWVHNGHDSPSRMGVDRHVKDL